MILERVSRPSYETLLLTLILVSLCLYSPLSMAEVYRWPLSKNYGVSATFGESRQDHFHAGIDLSTNGKTGLPVLAIADGEVYRLKVQKRAYGRALYIQHSGGIQSVYAHLDRYSDELQIEQIYQKTAAEMKTRYPGDIFIDPPIRVKKGDVVAYSGETGAGLPHLHLELRMNESTVLNPLTHGFQDPQDTAAPVFQSFYLYPVGTGSFVNGSAGLSEIRLKRKSTFYKADEIPVVRGDFLVSVSAYDSTSRPYRRSPLSYRILVDGKEVYYLEFQQFSYGQPDGFGLVYDQGKPGRSYFEYPVMLSRWTEFTPPFVKNTIPFSTRNLGPGLHEMRIEARDANQNVSLAQLNFIVNEPPRIELERVYEDAGDLVVSAVVRDANWKDAQPQSLAAVVEYSVDSGKTFFPFPMTILDLQSGPEALRFLYKLPVRQISDSPRTMIVKARGYDGLEYSTYTVSAIRAGKKPVFEEIHEKPEGRLRYETYSDGIGFFYETTGKSYAPISLAVGGRPESIPMEARELTSYQTILPAPKIRGTVQASVAGQESVSIPVDYARKGTAITIRRDNYELVLGEKCLYRDTFIWTKSVPEYSARTLPPVGPLLQLGPRGTPLQSDAILSFNYPVDLATPEKLSIYRWDRKKQSWSPLISPVNTSSRTVRAKISYLDLYALILDNSNPTVSYIFPKRNSSTRNATPRLAAVIRDTGMDVDDEKVTFYIDGVPYSAEYDPDRNVAVFQVTSPLKKGSHQFRVEALDYGGNKTVGPTVTFGVR